MTVEQEIKCKWTFEEYQERSPEYNFAELIDGELIMTPAPLRRHQILAGSLYAHIWTFLQQHPIGEVYMPPFDVRLNPDETKAYHPDVFFVSLERAGILTPSVSV